MLVVTAALRFVLTFLFFTSLLFNILLIYAFPLQVKPGGRIPEKGKKITVLVKNIDDLSRDVIKVCHLHSSFNCKGQNTM